MFPAFFSKVNAMGAPITGMIVLGVVQSLHGAVDDLAHPERAVQRAGQPRRGHQRHALHHRALGVDGDDAGRQGPGRSMYRRNVAMALVAMLYSIYAI